MNGKSLESVKLVPGWMSSKKTSSASHRYSKAALLDAYDPAADTEGLPPGMIEYRGVTSVPSLVPVNIAPSPPSSPLKTSSRPGVEAILSSRSGSHQSSVHTSRQHAGLPDLGRHTKNNAPALHVPHSTSNSRDFWSGSAHLAPVERSSSAASSSNNSNSHTASAAPTERRPLILKPRTVPPTDSSASSQSHNPYWSRSGSRSAADADTNWRGSAASVSNDVKPNVNGAASSSGVSSQSHCASSVRDGPKRMNNRDLSALTRGSAREASGNSSAASHTSTYHSLASGSGRDAGPLEPPLGLSSLTSSSSASMKSRRGAGSADATFDSSNGDSMANTSREEPRKSTDRAKSMWYYRDPQGSIQGPFSEEQILQWRKAGYYDDDLPVSRSRDSEFVALAVAFGLRPAPSGPPGFGDIAGLESSSKKDDSGGDMKKAEVEKPTRTIEDMAEEVERLRLEARSRREESEKRNGVSRGKSFLSSAGASGSIFDEPSSSSLGHRVEDSLKSELDFADVKGPKTSLGSHVDPFKVNRDTVGFGRDSHFGGSDALISKTAEDLKPRTAQEQAKNASPPEQSRFASFMGSNEDSREEPENCIRPFKEESSSNLVASKQSPVPDLSRLVHDSSQVSKTSAETDIASPAWNIMMQSLQQGDDRTRSATLPPMPTGASADHDIAALDPAIAHASFGRRPGNSDTRQVAPPFNSEMDDLRPKGAESSLSEKLTQILQQRGSVDDAQPDDASHRPPTMHPSVLQAVSSDLDGRPSSVSNYGELATSPPSSAPISSIYPPQWLQGPAQGPALNQAQPQIFPRAQAQVQAQLQAVQQGAPSLQPHSHHGSQPAHAAQAIQAVHAQAQAQAQAQIHAQAHAHARVHMVPAHQDPLWAYRQQIAQLQAQWEIVRRKHAEISQTLQASRSAVNAAPAGSVEQQHALSVTAQAETALNEHAINLDRIQHALQNALAQQMRHQQILAQQQQQPQQAQHQPEQVMRSMHMHPHEFTQPSTLPMQSNVLLAHQQHVQQQVPQLQEGKAERASVMESVLDVQQPRQYPVQHSDLQGETASPLEALVESSEVDSATKQEFPSVQVRDQNAVKKVKEVASGQSESRSRKAQRAVSAKSDSEPRAKVNSASGRSKAQRVPPPDVVDELNEHEQEKGQWEVVERRSKGSSSDVKAKDSSSGPALSPPDGGRNESPDISTSDLNMSRQCYEDTHVRVVSADEDPRLIAKAHAEAKSKEISSAPRPSVVTPAPWSNISTAASSAGLSLVEIQRQEELMREAAVNAEKEEAALAAANQRHQPVVSQPWGGASAVFPAPKMDLREQMRREQEQKQRSASVNNAHVSVRSSAPSTGAPQKTDWASLVASSRPIGPRVSAASSGKKADEEGLFWDAASSGTSTPRQLAGNARTGSAGNSSSRNVGNAAVPARRSKGNKSSDNSLDKSSHVSIEAEPAAGGARLSSDFLKWCTDNLKAFTGGATQDQSFVEYLCSFKASEEIRETLLQNLGSTDEASAFADEFIRRVEFERSSEPGDSSVSQNSGMGGKKKGRRRQASKVDPSLVLGFTSSSSRIMQGTIETPELK